MSKPTLVYVVLLIVCTGGLWGILRAGSQMSAVCDLTGDWTIESGPLGPVPGGPDLLGERLTIVQSGRFVRLQFQTGRTLDLAATTTPMGVLTKAEPIEFVGGGYRLHGTVWPEQQDLVASLTLASPRRSIDFVARRSAAKPPEGEPVEKPLADGPEGPLPEASMDAAAAPLPPR